MTDPQQPNPSQSLECDHCGGDAITSPDGMFSDGDGGKCAECGFPGMVSVSDDHGDDDVYAYWNIGDDAEDRCNQGDCEECRE